MKKSIISTLLALMIMCVAAPASAFITDWTLDLTSAGGIVNTGVDALGVRGDATITQLLGGNGVLDDFDPFFVDSYLSVLQIEDGVTNPTPPPAFVSVPGGDTLFFHGTGLTGHVINVVPGPGIAGAISFEYVYTGGLITLYAGDPAVVDASDVPLMSFSPALGRSDGAVNLGGSFPGTRLDLSVEIGAAAVGTGIISAPGYGDIEEYLFAHPDVKGFLVFDLINNLELSTLAFGPDHFSIVASSTGDATLVVTPEPSTFLIFGLGLLGLAAFRRKFA